MDGCGCGSLCQEETELLLKVAAFPDQQQRTLRMLVAAMKRAGVERDRRDRASALERELCHTSNIGSGRGFAATSL